MVAMELKPKKDERVPINFLISKDVDKKFRLFLAKKYGGFHRGVLAKELEFAISHFVDEQMEDK